MQVRNILRFLVLFLGTGCPSEDKGSCPDLTDEPCEERIHYCDPCGETWYCYAVTEGVTSWGHTGWPCECVTSEGKIDTGREGCQENN